MFLNVKLNLKAFNLRYMISVKDSVNSVKWVRDEAENQYLMVLRQHCIKSLIWKSLSGHERICELCQ